MDSTDSGSVEPLAWAPSGRVTRSLPVVAGYEIEAEIGRGGMGVVYRARQKRLNRTVALKMILAGDLAGEEAGVRFLAEAEAIARLQHPNIVQIFHIDESDGRPFFEMEYVTGGSLAEFLDGLPLPPREASRLIAEVARAIAEAHRVGIIHRDLKPGNILLDDDGKPKVADFGLAKWIDADLGPTRTDSILGSPNYMAPEQAEGKAGAVGPGTDIHALGAILFELLTGRPPYVSDTFLGTLQQVKTLDPVPPSRLVPGLPRDVETISLKCLEKTPSKRYASAGDLADDLDRFCRGEPILARPAAFWERGWKWALRRPAIAGLGLALVAVSVALLLLGAVSYVRIQGALAEARKDRTGALVARGEEGKARERAETARTTAEQARNAALAETYRASISEARALHAAHLPGWRGNAVSLLGRLATLPTPSRDLVALRSEAVACLGDFDVREVARLDAGDGDTLCLNFHDESNTLVAAQRGGGVHFWDLNDLKHVSRIAGHNGSSGWADPSHPRPLALAWPRRDALIHNTYDQGLAFTRFPGWGVNRPPITRSDAFVVAADCDRPGSLLALGWNDGLVEVRDLEIGATLRSLRSPRPQTLAISPNGQWLALSHADSTVQLVSVNKEGEEHPLAGPRGRVSVLRFSPNGSSLAAASENGVMIWDARSREQRFSLVGHKSTVNDVRFSDDNQRIATASSDHTVRVWEGSGGRELAVLEQTSFAVAVAFSRDGDHLATSCVYDPQVRIYRLDGRREKRQLFGHKSGVERVVTHPFRERMASGDVQGQIHLWELETGQLTGISRWTSSYISAIQYSPTGKVLAAAAGSETATINLMNLASLGSIRKFTGHHLPISALAFDRSGNLLASGDLNGVLKVWDVDRGTQKGEDLHLPSGAETLALVESGQTLLAQAKSGDLWRFDLSGHSPPRSVPIPGLGSSFTVDPTEKRVVIGGVDGGLTTVLLPDLTIANHYADGTTGLIIGISTSPNGKWLASGGEDRRVTLSDAATLRPLVRFPLRIGRVKSAVFDRTSELLVVCGIDSEPEVWDLKLLRDELTANGLDWDQPATTTDLMPSEDPRPKEIPRIQAPVSDPNRRNEATRLYDAALAQHRCGHFPEAIAQLSASAALSQIEVREYPSDIERLSTLTNTKGWLAIALEANHQMGESFDLRGECRMILEGVVSPTPGMLYDLACHCAQLSRAIGYEFRQRLDPTLEEFADRSMATLRRALDADPRYFRFVDTDHDLDPIRNQPGFEAIRLDAQFPRDPFTTPSPLAQP